MKVSFIKLIMFCVSGLLISPATATAIDFNWKKLANEILKEATNQPQQPTPSPRSPTSRDTTGRAYKKPSTVTKTNDQLCNAIADWLSSSQDEWNALQHHAPLVDVAVDRNDSGASTYKQTTVFVRLLNDGYFTPAIGKPFDQLSQSEREQMGRLMVPQSSYKKVNGQMVNDMGDCYESFQARGPGLARTAERLGGIFFGKRERPEAIKAIVEMREARNKLDHYLHELESLEQSAVGKSRYDKIKLDSYYWLELSMLPERQAFEGKLAEVSQKLSSKSANTTPSAQGQLDTDLEYTGPKRFTAIWAKTNKRQPEFDSKVPLFSIDQGGFENGFEESRRLTNAGYKVMRCQYGPFRGAEGGFSEEYYWKDRRGVLSAASVQEQIRKGSSSDIALPACPPTYGEALAYTLGVKEPPIEGTLAKQKGEARKAGQRFTPEFVTRSDFENTEFSLDGSNVVDDLETVLIPYRVDKSAVPAVIISEIARLKASGTRLVQCRYKIKQLMVSESRETVHFWSGRKPDAVSDTFGSWVEKREIPLVDTAVSECPEYLGEAIALAQAAGTKEALAKAKDAAKRADADPIKPVKVRNDWHVGAKANSAQEDAQLAKELEREVSGLVGGSGLTWQGFNSTVKTRIAPKLLSLARSAYAQVDKLPAGERGRAAFEKWDELTAGTVMRSILRLERVIASNTTERMAFSDVMKNESQLAREKSERDGWQYNANVEFTRPIYYYFLPKYGDRFSKMSILDPSFIANVGKGLKSSTGSATNSTDLWKGGSQVTFKETTTIVFGTPEEIAAWEFASDVGQNVGKAIVYWGQFKGSIQQLDQQIKESRAKFWQCYAKRCKDAARLYQDYSTVLYWKDMHYLVQPALLRKQAELSGDKNQTMQTLFKMGGAEEVDGGMPTSCSSEQSTFEAQVSTVFSDWKGGSLNTYKTKLDNAFKGPAYTNWQQCRDKMEYIMRPRNP